MSENIPNHPRRLVYFDSFRGLTILLVVAGHCYNNWLPDTFLEKIVANLITGATALFVFISGFFFDHVFRGKFDYSKFMRKKISAVLMPYLNISIISIIVLLIVRGNISFPVNISENSFINDGFKFLMTLATGRIWTGYWYIPFIMLMFAASPLFLRFCNIQSGRQIACILFFLALGMLIHRPLLNLNPVHSAFYFSGFYLAGIFYSQNRVQIDQYMGPWTGLVFLGVAIFISALMVSVGQIGNLHKVLPWTLAGFDWMVPLKIATIAALVAMFQNYRFLNLSLLQYFAKISFPLFFVSPILIFFYEHLYFKNVSHSGVYVVFIFILVLISSVIGISLMRYFLGSRARLLIGP
jgi:probable poly-beta-1,6-N-acetyl-D-glucosamine export protein